MRYWRIVLAVWFATLFVSMSAEAGSKKWDVFVTSVGSIGGVVLSEFLEFSSSDASASEFSDRVVELEAQLATFDREREGGPEYDKIARTVAGLKNMTDLMNKRVDTLEGKLQALEQRVKILESDLPVLSDFSIRDLNTIYVKPSFNCAKAREPIEYSICGSPILSDIDNRMGQLYWELRRKLPQDQSNALKQNQLAWLGHRDRVCKSNDDLCLVENYRSRINELQEWLQ